MRCRFRGCHAASLAEAKVVAYAFSGHVGFGILDDIDVASAMNKTFKQDMPPAGSWVRAIHLWRTAAKALR